MIVRVTFNIHTYFFLGCNFESKANKGSVIRLRRGEECTWMDSVGKKLYFCSQRVLRHYGRSYKVHIMQIVSGFDMAAPVGILQLLSLDVNRMWCIDLLCGHTWLLHLVKNTTCFSACLEYLWLALIVNADTEHWHWNKAVTAWYQYLVLAIANAWQKSRHIHFYTNRTVFGQQSKGFTKEKVFRYMEGWRGVTRESTKTVSSARSGKNGGRHGWLLWPTRVVHNKRGRHTVQSNHFFSNPKRKYPTKEYGRWEWKSMVWTSAWMKWVKQRGML